MNHSNLFFILGRRTFMNHRILFLFTAGAHRDQTTCHPHPATIVHIVGSI